MKPSWRLLRELLPYLAALAVIGIYVGPGIHDYMKARKAAAVLASAAAEKEQAALNSGDLTAWSNYVCKAIKMANTTNAAISVVPILEHHFLLTEQEFAEYMRKGLHAGYAVSAYGGQLEDCDWLLASILAGQSNVLETLRARLRPKPEIGGGDPVNFEL